MLKVIRQNTVIKDYDDLRIFKVVSVGDGRNGRTHCIEYDFLGTLVNDDTILLNREITNIVFKNDNARAVFRPEENENLHYKVFIKRYPHNRVQIWKHGFDLQQLITDLAYEMLFEDNGMAKIEVGHYEKSCNSVTTIEVGHYEKSCNWVTIYETKWITKDCVQEIDDYYSDPKHAYDTLEECIEYLKETTSWI